MNESGDRKPIFTLSRLVAYLLLLLGAAMIPILLRISVDNRMELFINPDSAEVAQYKRFCNLFGNDEYLIVAYTGKDLFEEESLDKQVEVMEALKKVPYVRRVLGIPQVYQDVFGEEDPEALKRDFLSTPFYTGYLISKDAQVGGLFVETDKPQESGGRRDMMQGISQTLEILKRAGFEVYVVGAPALHVVMEKITQQEGMRTFPLAFALSTVALLVLFRSVRVTVVALFCMGLTIALTVGLIGVVGRPLNMVTSCLPVIIWVLALAYLIHILRRYQETHKTAGNIRGDMRFVLRDTVLPVFMDFFTTAAGFLSLLTSAMIPIKELGVFAAVGLTLSFIVSVTVCPMLVEWLRVPSLGPRGTNARKWTFWVSSLAIRRSNTILVLGTLLVGLTLWGMARVKVESNTLTFLPREYDIVKSYKFVAERLTGLEALEVAIQVPSGWLNAQEWPELIGLIGEIERWPEVGRILSPYEVLKKINQGVHEEDPSFYVLPGSREEAQSLVSMLDEQDRASLNRMVSSDGKTVRLSILAHTEGSSDFMALAERVKDRIQSLPAPLKGYTTGIGLQLASVELNLVQTQISSFAFSFIPIFLCIFLGLRSWRLTLVSFFPNMVPGLATFGFMALSGIKMDVATVMVAGVTLGISVDNSIHFMVAYQKFRKARETAEEAIHDALARVGPAILISTTAACIGFFALSQSAFTPIRYFGILSGLAMIIALLSNVFMVPAILTFWSKRSHRPIQ